MPIYEYKCKSCGKVIEVIQKLGDRPLRKCRACSGPLEKLISRTSFQLKGGGWFEQGYHKGGSKAASGSTGSSKSSAKSTGSESKSSSKSKSSSGGGD